jgi:hypothetical protein
MALAASSRFEHLEPAFDVSTEQTHINSRKAFRTALQPHSCSLEQGTSAPGIATLKMMKGSRHLNQSLQKRFFRFVGRQPNAFPVLVSPKKLLRAIASQAGGKFSFRPIELHRETLPHQAILRPTISIPAATRRTPRPRPIVSTIRHGTPRNVCRKQNVQKDDPWAFSKRGWPTVSTPVAPLA